MNVKCFQSAFAQSDLICEPRAARQVHLLPTDRPARRVRAAGGVRGVPIGSRVVRWQRDYVSECCVTHSQALRRICVVHNGVKCRTILDSLTLPVVPVVQCRRTLISIEPLHVKTSAGCALRHVAEQYVDLFGFVDVERYQSVRGYRCAVNSAAYLSIRAVESGPEFVPTCVRTCRRHRVGYRRNRIRLALLICVRCTGARINGPRSKRESVLTRSGRGLYDDLELVSSIVVGIEGEPVWRHPFVRCRGFLMERRRSDGVPRIV